MNHNKLNYTKAGNAIDILATFLQASKEKQQSFNFNGFDNEDFVNSVKLYTACLLFVSEAEKIDFAGEFESSLFMYATITEINEKRKINFDDFLGNETVTMFYEKCLKFNKNEPDNYWNLVFSHLGIECDETDKDHRIYKRLIDENERKVNSKIVQIEKPAEINKNTKEVIITLITISILVFSFSNETIRIITFILLNISNLIFLEIRIGAKAYKSIRHKLGLIYDVLTAFFLIYGIFNNDIGLILTYVLILIFTFHLTKSILKVVFKEN